VYNVGSGKGSSVEEVVRTAAEVLNRMIPIEVGPVRAGDPSISIADATLIDKEMGFKTEYSDLETILKTTWNYFSQVYKTAPK
jgi:UDP-glucose 4-epimerase